MLLDSVLLDEGASLLVILLYAVYPTTLVLLVIIPPPVVTPDDDYLPNTVALNYVVRLLPFAPAEICEYVVG